MGKHPVMGMETRMQTTEALMAISDKLAKIKDRSASLNKKTDQFNATIEHIEKELLGSGVEFWWINGPEILGDSTRGEGGEIESARTVLGYTKINGVWHIAAQMRWYRPGDMDVGMWELVHSEMPVPLARASRTIRIEAAKHLEAFLEGLYLAQGEMEEQLDQANAMVTGRAEPDPDGSKARAKFEKALVGGSVEKRTKAGK